MKPYLFLITGSFLFFSCGKKPKEGNKLFVVDHSFCGEVGLPNIEFSVEYPDSMWVMPAEKGFINETYNNFYLKRKGITTEFIALAFYKPSANFFLFDDLKQGLVNQLLRKMQMEWHIDSSSTERIKIGNDSYYGFRAYARPRRDIDFPTARGSYLIQSLLIEPENQENGVGITFYANESSEIKTFDDFTKKGSVSVVWNTLMFGK